MLYEQAVVLPIFGVFDVRQDVCKPVYQVKGFITPSRAHTCNESDRVRGW